MSKVRFTWSVDGDLIHRLKVQAAKEQRDVSEILADFAMAYLAEKTDGGVQHNDSVD